MDVLLSVPRTDETQRIAVERADRVCRPLTVAIAEHIAAKGGRVCEVLRAMGFVVSS